MIFFRMLRNVVRASVITQRNIILNRAFLARGSNTKKEKQEKSPKNDESTSSNQQTSSKTRFGWNDLYMRSHYDSDTKSKGEETKEKLSDFTERMKQNKKEYDEKQRLKTEFNKKREKEIADFMETDQYKDHNQFVSNELFKIMGVLFVILVFMKLFTSA